MSSRDLWRRIKRLERAQEQRRAAEVAGEAPEAIVVLYDPATGEPLRPVPEGAKVQVWLPDNGRDKAPGPALVRMAVNGNKWQ